MCINTLIGWAWDSVVAVLRDSLHVDSLFLAKIILTDCSTSSTSSSSSGSNVRNWQRLSKVQL